MKWRGAKKELPAAPELDPGICELPETGNPELHRQWRPRIVCFCFCASLRKAPSCSIATKAIWESSRPSRSRSRLSAGIRSALVVTSAGSPVSSGDRFRGQDGLERFARSGAVMDQKRCFAEGIFGSFRIKQAAQGEINAVSDGRIFAGAQAVRATVLFRAVVAETVAR